VGVTRQATRSRTATAVRSAPSRAKVGDRLDNVGEQRIYHLTHVRNLPAILESGILYADQNPAWDVRPVVDIASVATREDRRTTPVAGSGDATVAHFVPFFLSPNASIWQSIRSGEPEPGLSRDVAGADVSEFVLLVSTVKTIAESDASYVVSDADAAHVLTRFATTHDDAERSLRRLRADMISDSLEHAEFLVRESVPFTAISLIGVAHDKARAAVKQALSGAAHAPKVAVYPPWFAVPEED
jgi:hypothetical protein